MSVKDAEPPLAEVIFIARAMLDWGVVYVGEMRVAVALKLVKDDV